MKVIQIVTQMEAGGAQKVASQLAEGLRLRGHDSQTWFLYKKRPAYEETPYVECLNGQRPQGAAWLGVAGRLWRRLRGERPDVVVTHTHSSNPFAAPIAAMAGVPVRIAVHHNPADSFTSIARTADRIAFSSGSYSSMVAVSGGVSRSFALHGAHYRSRLHRIYNGIATVDEPSSDPAVIDVRLHYPIPDHHAVLVTVGRLARQKNQAILFKMLREIPSASLLLVGEGELRLELRASAIACGVAHRVHFTGELPPQEVQGILRQADLFVLPSLYESFCLAAVEAMQAGLPVVASDLSCLREVLGDEQIFFDLHDEQTLIRIVRTLLAAPEQRAAMGAAGRVRASRFNLERMVGEYECLMTEELLYASRWKSAAHDLGGLDTLRRIPRVHD